MADTLEMFETEQKVAEGQQTAAPEGQKDTQVQVPPSSEGKKDAEPKEPVVIIDGKEMPLKNYEGERIRKLKEKHQQELDEARVHQVQQPHQQPQQQDWVGQVEQEAINEMTASGKSFPWQTMMRVSDAIYRRNYGAVANSSRQADIMREDFIESIEDEADYSQIKKPLRALLRKLPDQQVNQQTLEICLNSVRGQRIKDIEKSAYERGIKDAEKDTKIVGPTDAGSSTTQQQSGTLTPAQQVEFDEMNRDTEIVYEPKEYLKMLESKRERFKAAGTKNIPQTLNDKMIT